MPETPQVTPEELVDLEVPSEVKISPQGNQVVYTLKPSNKKGKHSTSALWIAEIGKKHSARQLTSGLFFDRSPQWSPDGNSIVFLSDRTKAGKSCAIYILSLNGGEAYPVTNIENEKTISKFTFNFDGNSIAFLSADEESEERKRKETEKQDAKVYGEHWDYARLRLLHVKTKHVETLVKGNFHVADFTWMEKKLAFIVHRTPDPNSAGYFGSVIKVFSVIDKEEAELTTFPGPINANSLAFNGSELWFIAGYSPKKACTSYTLYSLTTTKGKFNMASLQDKDAMSITCSEREKNAGYVLFQSGLQDIIHRKDENSDKCICTRSQAISAWDALLWKVDSSLLAIVTSSPGSPSELYAGEQSHVGLVRSESNLIQLSNHSEAINTKNLAIGQEFRCTASDNSKLDAVFLKPPSFKAEKPALPTVVLIHGGPYSRSTIAFDPSPYSWAPYLLSAGYGILCPNYRGGSSHGEKWSSAASGTMGTGDYSDVIDIVKAAIKDGLIHPEKVVVGGWSQGGFLSYLSAIRSDFNFRGAMCGAGVTDWDMLCMTSDLPWFEAELTGEAPWLASKSAEDIHGRHGSAIWHMQKTKKADRTPVLILHGEEDKRVPLTQAIAFHRGCLALNWPCEFVVYPREEHRIKEREHLIDMLVRVRKFCDFHLA